MTTKPNHKRKNNALINTLLLTCVCLFWLGCSSTESTASPNETVRPPLEILSLTVNGMGVGDTISLTNGQSVDIEIIITNNTTNVYNTTDASATTQENLIQGILYGTSDFNEFFQGETETTDDIVGFFIVNTEPILGNYRITYSTKRTDDYFSDSGSLSRSLYFGTCIGNVPNSFHDIDCYNSVRATNAAANAN